MREKLIALSIVKKGNWNEIYQFLRSDKNLDSISEMMAFQIVRELQVGAITILDDDYPANWHEISKPPFVVYYKGNKNLIGGKIVSIIGGKTTSEYTKKEISNLLTSLPTDYIIANGCEQGIESLGLSTPRNKIVCLASGFAADEIYRKRNGYSHITENDLILSELPPAAKFDLAAYYRSYHLIVELSHAISVFELSNYDLRNKYLAYLAEVGKPVAVLPDKKNGNTAGGLELLNKGAKCLLNARIIGEMVEDA